MKLAKRKLTGREKDEAAIQLLEKLREQLHTGSITVTRQTAFHLSWLQEDGLEILQEALFSRTSSRRTKNAASYGLRKMRGRMAKLGLNVLKEGTDCPDPIIARTCRNALDVYHNKGTYKPRRSSHRKKRSPRFEIRDVPARDSRRPNRSRRYVRHSPR